MMRKLFQRFQNAYEPLVVLLIVGVALLLIYALYRATGGGSGSGYSIVAMFDDVTGIKERSKVLFKGMPVGSVRELKYDATSDHIMVRLDIDRKVEIPANIQPSLESSLFGEAHISLKTIKEKPSRELLATLAGNASRETKELLRLEGVEVSRAESIMPGFTELAEVTKKTVKDFNNEMNARLSGPVRECVEELKLIIKGPEGQADKSLAAELQRAVDQLESHSVALHTLFNGNADGSSKGLIRTVDEVGGDWSTLVKEVTDGKNEAIDQLESVSKSLDLAGRAIARSESEVKKLGKASDKLGAASETVTEFVNVVKRRPNSLVWGLNGQQKAMLDQPKPTGAGKR